MLIPSTPKWYETPIDGIQEAVSWNWKPSLPRSNQNQRGRLTRKPTKATTLANHRTALSLFLKTGRSRTSAPRSGV